MDDLTLVDAIHALNRKDFRVQFIPSGQGTMTIVYTHRQKDIFMNETVGYANASLGQVTKSVLSSVTSFLQKSDSLIQGTDF